MASSSDNISMAVFCDFENVALGVRDANYEKFDIKPVLERLLLKGSIVVKKAYCDWERYKGFKAAMHEANFELIEIPHVRQSGKNSADIRLVVDALDLCYTKSHVNTFVIISGDSDFSPLVSKLRENNKHVIAVGVKQSTSDLLVANCDEFIFYDDLEREVKRTAAKREERKARPPAEKRPPSDDANRRKEELEARKALALEMVVETFDALISERGDSGKIWASLLKDTLKRRRPEFNESYFGFSTFGKLLEEAQTRGLLEFGRDEKSGAYVYRSQNAAAPAAGINGSEELPQRDDEQGDDVPAASVEQLEEPAEQPARVNGRGRNERNERNERTDRNGRPQQEERPRSRTSFRTPVVHTGPDETGANDEGAQPDLLEADTAQPDVVEAVQPQPNPRGRNRGRDRDRNRQPGDAQPAVNAGQGQPGQPPAPKQPNQPGQSKQEGRNRGRNRDRVPAEGQPNRDRMPAEAQPKSHENALPPELRGRGRGRNSAPRSQNAARYPEASEELAFHKQQQALEAAAAAAGQVDDIAPEPVNAPAPVMMDAPAPAASERRRAPRKTAAQKAADAAGAVSAAVDVPAEPVATPEPAVLPDVTGGATADVVADVAAGVVANPKPARKPAARKTAAAKVAADAPVADAADAPAADVPAAEVASKPAAKRRTAKPKADQA
jgi:uncharacterized LabA/DUF88 family protein